MMTLSLTLKSRACGGTPESWGAWTDVGWAMLNHPVLGNISRARAARPALSSRVNRRSRSLTQRENDAKQSRDAIGWLPDQPLVFQGNAVERDHLFPTSGFIFDHFCKCIWVTHLHIEA